jgi:hypothetical protein
MRSFHSKVTANLSHKLETVIDSFIKFILPSTLLIFVRYISRTAFCSESLRLVYYVKKRMYSFFRNLISLQLSRHARDRLGNLRTGNSAILFYA